MNLLATTNEVSAGVAAAAAGTGPQALKTGDRDHQGAPHPAQIQSNDLTMELHRVLGSLESQMENRKQSKSKAPATQASTALSNDVISTNTVDTSEVDLESNFLGEAREV